MKTILFITPNSPKHSSRIARFAHACGRLVLVLLLGALGAAWEGKAQCSYVIAGPPGWSLIANQCVNDNSIGTLLPSVPIGTLFLKFNNLSQTYEPLNVFSGAWSVPSQTLAPGEGAWLYNPANAPLNIAISGGNAAGGLQTLGNACYLVSRKTAAA